MNFQPHILNAKQKRLLKPLGNWAASHGFYLAGGTALALMLGHRQSVDFDFFTQQYIPDPLRLVTELQDAGFTVEPQSVMLRRTSWKQVKQEIQAAVKAVGLNG